MLLSVFFLMAVFFPQMVRATATPKDEKLRGIKSELHRYSGLNPDLYFECMNDLELMEKVVLQHTDLAAEYLYLAIEKANKMALYSTGVHTYAIDEVRAITARLGFRGEELIMKHALTTGQGFRPIYLNNLSD